MFSSSLLDGYMAGKWEFDIIMGLAICGLVGYLCA